MAKAGVPLFSRGAVDPALDQLFSKSLSKEPLKSQQASRPTPARVHRVEQGDDSDSAPNARDSDEPGSDAEPDSEDIDDEDEQSDLSDAGVDLDVDVSVDSAEEPNDSNSEPEEPSKPEPSRKKRKRADDADLEDNYLAKLARVAEADEKRSKRQKAEAGQAAPIKDIDGTNSDADSETGDVEEEGSDFEIPKHETQDGTLKKGEVDQANRTVFLGNVSTDAIKSKESKRELEVHLTSFFDPKSKDKHKLESIRFRSVAFASTAIPRKAAFAKKDLLDATTKSTNAYVVYSSPALAKLAVEKLNGTVVLDRHLRVDSVAHPQPVDHRRCVFVGNLGFVDDESLMQDKGEDDKPKKRRAPADLEEGLWRQFGKAGTVESVRVIRDKSTRVGKGFAYVQFTDQIAVEKALEFHEKKYPPMLPRILRVTRAKKMTKTNSYKEKARVPANGLPNGKPNGKVYNPKADPNQLTAKGRATKLFGRAGAAQLKKGKEGEKPIKAMRRPEDFVFEGHRARDAEGKGTMNLKQKKKAGKPQNRSSKRGAAFKAAGRKKKTD